MEILGVIVGGGIIFLIWWTATSYLSILESTLEIASAFWALVALIIWFDDESWWTLVFLLWFIIALYQYFSNKRKEQVILMTIRLMISKENYKTISVLDIVKKLGYDNKKFSFDDDKKMVTKTLKVYKSKGLIPYNIDVEYDTDDEEEKEVEKEVENNKGKL